MPVTADRSEGDPQAIAAHYDALDLFYREIWGWHIHHGLWLDRGESYEKARENLVRFIAERARLDAGTRVCDIGCGYGETAGWIAEQYGSEVVGITISSSQHLAARTRFDGHARLSFVLGDWLQHELPPATFDAAIVIESTEHMPDLDAFFRQARYVLRPGGRLVIAAWHAADNTRAWHQRYLLRPVSRDAHLVAFRTIGNYRSAAATAGFCEERCDDITPAVMRTWPTLIGTFARALARRPGQLRYLLGEHSGNRRLGSAALRTWLAYRVGALRYHVLTFAIPS